MYGLGVNALAGGAARLWTPAEIATGLWLDAADTGSISSTGGLVDQWNDKSGNARHFTGSGATRPTTGANTKNGLNVLTLAADYLNAAVGALDFMHDGTVDYSVHVVVQFGTTADPNTLYGLMGSNAGSSGNKGATLFYDDRASVPRNNNMGHLISSGAGQLVNNIAGDNFCTANAYHLVRARAFINAAAYADRSFLRVDQGTEINNGTGTTNTPVTGNSTYVMQIGTIGNNTLPLTGYLSEIVVPIAASLATQAEVDNYLKAKWGI